MLATAACAESDAEFQSSTSEVSPELGSAAASACAPTLPTQFHERSSSRSAALRGSASASAFAPRGPTSFRSIDSDASAFASGSAAASAAAPSSPSELNARCTAARRLVRSASARVRAPAAPSALRSSFSVVSCGWSASAFASSAISAAPSLDFERLSEVQPSAMLQRDAERRRSVLEHSVAAEAARRSENIVESRVRNEVNGGQLREIGEGTDRKTGAGGGSLGSLSTSTRTYGSAMIDTLANPDAELSEP